VSVFFVAPPTDLMISRRAAPSDGDVSHTYKGARSNRTLPNCIVFVMLEQLIDPPFTNENEFPVQGGAISGQ
jgi:hypothetical protein